MEIRKQATVPLFDDYSQLSFRHDREQGILWYFMQPRPRPCFTPALLNEIQLFERQVTTLFNSGRNRQDDIRYLVMASKEPDFFSLGGDLSLFLRLIRNRDKEGLTRYARACIDGVYPLSINLNLPLTTIALVQGNALGGGFEAALGNSVLVAERSARMGLPEILFNLFPGMGAFSFLARRLGTVRAERIILSGRNYSAEELYEMGAVDVLAEDGEGEEAVYQYVKRHNRLRNGITAIQRVRQRYQAVSYEELLEITLLWVDSALQLGEQDLHVMERLVKAQNRRRAPAEEPTRIRTPRGRVASLHSRLASAGAAFA